ncbi:MAG TPA: BTAD domain-containing putative transcriptional regulator, partial [Longimicrobiales bacterium]|nr:BTAD domain-containing putative transcriptional regulator [Longimicrobiales bacterium]
MAANLELRTLGMVDLRAADGRVLQSVLAQPKRLALLVYLTLAQASGGFFRRDRLVALFWPELDEEHARAALRNTVYNLRRTLGHEAIGRRGDEEIGIAAGYLTCDATVFEASVSSGDPAAALALYRGDLLPGFYIPDAPAFDEWLEQRRTQLRRTAADAAWRHAEVAGLPPDELVARAHRAAELSGVNESTLRRLLLAFERAGDRAGAAHAFDDFRRRLHAEFDLEPSAELFCLRDRIREGGRVATVAPGPPPAAVAAVAPWSPPAAVAAVAPW